MTTIIPLALLIVLILAGLPVAYSLGISGIVGSWMIAGDIAIAKSFLGLVPLETVADFVILALPMFLLIAYLASVSRLADDLYQAATAWLSGVRGGLALSTVVAGAAMGALSGTTTAAASGLSGISVRNQVRAGYSTALASGTAALSATTAVLIPPSILMIIYGTMTETSVGALLTAGLVPGVLLAVMIGLTIRTWIGVNPSAAPRPFKTSWPERAKLTVRVWPSVLIVLLIFGALYSGLMTPTEIAGLGALITALMAAVLGRLKWGRLWEASIQAVQATAMIMMIVIGGTLFARYLSLTRLPQDLAANVVEADLNRWLVIAIIIASYFVLSMFMDELPLLILTLPVTFPIITDLGFDPIWFGVISCLMVIMGLVFPPVGVVVFVVSAATGVRTGTVFRGTTILIVPVFLTTILVVIFPGIALWLPGMR